MTEHQRPYASAAPLYHARGWAGPLPVRGKWPPPTGWTGTNGAWPSYPDLMAWIDGPEGDLNIGLRLPRHVLGIDVDDYDTKTGGRTLADHEARFGPLPATWVAGSRGDGVSGIRLYAVPEGMHWPGELRGGGVELIQHKHRYAMVWPSIHPDTGRRYEWLWGGTVAEALTQMSADGEDFEPPNVEDLPNLPEAWIEGLTGGRSAEDVIKADLGDAQALAWLAQNAGGGQCPATQRALTRCAGELLTKGASRHDAAMRGVARLVHLASEGHAGGLLALDQLRAAFGTATNDPSRAGEWSRLVTGAVQIAAVHASAEHDPCLTPFIQRPEGSSTWTATHPPATCSTAPGSTSPSTAPAASTGHGSSGAMGHASDRPVSTSPATPTAGTTTAPLPGAGAPDASAEQPPEELTAWTPPNSTSSALPLSSTATTRSGTASGAATTYSNGSPSHPGAGSLGAIAAVPTAPGSTTTSPPDDPARALAIAGEVAQLQVRREARRIVDQIEAAASFREPPSTFTLADELRIPSQPISYAVDQLLPRGGNVLLTAQFKAGKTSLINNLARSFTDGEAFLGRFEVRPLSGRVGMFNYEVGEDQYRDWLRDVGFERPDRAAVLNLRGFRLPLHVPSVEDWVVRWLAEREIEVWFVDPFARAFGGANENDNSEVGRWLDTLDVIKARAGVSELVLPVHTGRQEFEVGQERARGATRLDDWTDVRWFLNKDDADLRYFSATGRDVQMDEECLEFDQATRRLTMSGGNRKHRAKRIVEEIVIDLITRNPGIGSKQLRDGVRDRLGKAANPEVDAVVKALYRRNEIRIEALGVGKPTRHYLAEPLTAFTFGEPA